MLALWETSLEDTPIEKGGHPFRDPASREWQN